MGVGDESLSRYGGASAVVSHHTSHDASSGSEGIR